MKPMWKKTMIAALAASVALGGALPVLAQQDTPAAPAPAMGPMGFGGIGPIGDFKSLDADGDGKVTLAEMQAKRAEAVKGVDADGDGLLNAEELLAAELAQAKPRMEARIKARFAALDSDKDGKLSAAELSAPPMPTRMFERMDANNDGALSAEEMAAMQARMAKRMQDRGWDGDDWGRRGHHGDRDGRGWFGFGGN